MSVLELLKGVARQTVAERGGFPTFITNLHERSGAILPPNLDSSFANPADDFAFAILNRDADPMLRHFYARRAIEKSKRSLIQNGAQIGGLDADEIVRRSQGISTDLVNGIVTFASTYPRRTSESKGFGNTVMQLLKPNQDRESTATSACVIFDLFQPYLIKRLLELNIHDSDLLKTQFEAIQRDSSLLLDFYGSIAHSVEFALDGTSSVNASQMAEELFGLGPLFVKMAQSMTGVVGQLTPNNENFAKAIGSAFQENIAPPNVEEERMIASGLPAGLVYQRKVSSASIAHVVEVKDPDGNKLVTKVPRAGIKKALERNTQTYKLLSEILFCYVEEHAQGTPLARSSANLRGAIDFFLKTVQGEIAGELDFLKEAEALGKAGQIFNDPDHKIVIPTLDQAHSNEDLITMSFEPAKRISELLANPRILANIATFVVRSLKNHFFHGDLHAGNLKGRENGDIVVYDLGKSIEIPKHFFRNIERYMYAVVRKNPQAIARTYERIQSQEHKVANLPQIMVVVNEVMQNRKERENSASASKLPKPVQEASDITQEILLAMGIRYQSTLDPRYLTFMKSSIALMGVVIDEISKPEYADKKYRESALMGVAKSAIKEAIKPRKLSSMNLGHREN